MRNTNNDDVLGSLFPRSYPIEINPGSYEISYGKSSGLFRRETPDKSPMMQVHVTRSHFGEILIGAASTGQNGIPQRFRENDNYHNFPTYTGDSWRTRFDGGRDGGSPHIMVAFYITQGEPNSNDETSWTDLEKLYAKILVNGDLTAEHYLELDCEDEWVLNDDGLEMVYYAIKSLEQEENKIEEKDLPDYILESLNWAIEHIKESFGQGKIPRKRK